MYRHFLTLLFLSVFSFTAFAKDTVYVYAASSMTDVVSHLARYFAEQDIEVKGVFGSSSSLARQVTSGAPADIYISANQQWMTYLLQQQTPVQDPVVLATNQLVVIARPGVRLTRTDDLSQWQQLLQNNRLATGDDRHVPVGIYSKQALQSLGLWQDLIPKLAPMKNSRAVLAMVERGQTPVGIVYETDARQSKRVDVAARFSTTLHQPIEYPGVLLSTSQSAADVYDYLTSDSMQAHLLTLGFTLPQEGH